MGGYIATGDLRCQARIIQPVNPRRRAAQNFGSNSTRGIRDALQGGHRSLLMHPAQFRVEENALDVSLR